MLLLPQGQLCTHTHVVLHARKLYVVSFAARHKLCWVYLLHMPNRSEERKCYRVLNQAHTVHVAAAAGYELFLGDGNRHVRTHVMTLAFTTVVGAMPVCDGTEGDLQEDSAMIGACRTTVAKWHTITGW